MYTIARDEYTPSMEYRRCRPFGYWHSYHMPVYASHPVGFLEFRRHFLFDPYMISSAAEVRLWLTVSSYLGLADSIHSVYPAV